MHLISMNIYIFIIYRKCYINIYLQIAIKNRINLCMVNGYINLIYLIQLLIKKWGMDICIIYPTQMYHIYMITNYLIAIKAAKYLTNTPIIFTIVWAYTYKYAL